MKAPRVKVDTAAQAKADQAIAAATEAANNLKKNFSADLSNSNAATVVAGAAADDSALGDSTLKRKKAPITGLASALGID